MLIEKGNNCAKVHPLMGNMPKPNAYEEGEDEHPHLAFEVDHTIFQKADINPVFIHYQTKVCVDGPSENCFPEKCPDDARQLIDTEHMLSDFVQGGHMDENGQIIPNNIAKIVFDPLQDPDREKKQTWNQIITENFDKIESAKQRSIKSKNDVKAKRVTHNRIYSDSNMENDEVIISSGHANRHNRSSRSTISPQPFQQVYTIGPFNLLYPLKKSYRDYKQANIELIQSSKGVGHFLMSGPGYFAIIAILSTDIFLAINLLRNYNYLQN